MGDRCFGMLGGFFGMTQVAMIDGFFKVAGTLFEMCFLFSSIDDRAGKRMFQRGVGMLDQYVCMAGFTVFDGSFGMFECGGGMFLRKSGRADG